MKKVILLKLETILKHKAMLGIDDDKKEFIADEHTLNFFKDLRDNASLPEEQT